LSQTIRRSAAEFIGTALLLAAIVGSGIMAQRLSPHDVGLQLLENDFATGCALVAIILALSPVSGAHLNPLITLVDRYFCGLTTQLAACYIAAQLVGGVAGSVAANLMFGLPMINPSHKVRGTDLWLAEVIATLGLVLVVFGVVRSGRASITPFAVGAYIGAAYFFTASTSFANPAVTIARTLSDTFAGISPGSTPIFVLAECVGAALALLLVKLLYPGICRGC
jgi:glycerol uptake facilitator-like aquaporin